MTSFDSASAQRWSAMKRKTGYYHTVQGVLSATAIVNSRQYAWPLFMAEETLTITRIGLEVTIIGAGTGGAGTPVIRLGIYEDDGTLYPGNLILDAGTIDATSATYQEKTISQVVGPKVVWLSCAAQGCDTTAPTVRCVSSSVAGIAGQTNTISSQAWASYWLAGITGAFATFGSGLQTTTIAPRIHVKC